MSDDDNDPLLVSGRTFTLLALIALVGVLAIFGGLLYSCEAQRDRLSECTKTHPVDDCKRAFQP